MERFAIEGKGLYNVIKMIKAILFDMNGIIIDDEHIHELAFQQTVQPYGVNLTHQEYLENCAGKTDRAGYESIAEKFKVDLSIDLLLTQKSQTYLKLFPANKKSYPWVIDLIWQLKKKFRLALTSSSSKTEVELITKEFSIRDAFEVMITGDDVSKGKPDPEPYLKTAQLLKLIPNNCCVIEDSKSGILSAKSAGCFCIGVTTTHDKEALNKADVIVNSFGEITENLINNL